MRASTASLWWMAITGPSASTLRSLSVTIVAISMMRSESGLSPVISRSIQMRFSGDFMQIQAAKNGMVAEHADPKGPVSGVGTVLASYGRGVLVQAAWRDPALRALRAQAARGLRRSRRLGISTRRRRTFGSIRRTAPQSHRTHRCARPRRARGRQYRPAGHRGRCRTRAGLVLGRPLLGRGRV